MTKKISPKKTDKALKEFAATVFSAFQPDIDHCMQQTASSLVLSSKLDLELIQRDVVEYLTRKYGDTPLNEMLYNRILKEIKKKYFNE